MKDKTKKYNDPRNNYGFFYRFRDFLNSDYIINEILIRPVSPRQQYDVTFPTLVQAVERAEEVGGFDDGTYGVWKRISDGTWIPVPYSSDEYHQALEVVRNRWGRQQTITDDKTEI